MGAKFFPFVFALCFIMPCVFLFSACGDKPVTAEEIVAEVNNQQFVVSNGKIYFDYGEPISFSATDFSVAVVYSDGSKMAIDSSNVGGYTVEWNHSSSEILDDGTYNLKILYQDFAFNFDVVVVKQMSAMPVFATDALTYNGQKQKPIIQNASDINWQLIDIENADNYDEYGNVDAGSYALTLSLKDKLKTSWADGSTDDIVFDWQIEPRQIQIPEVDLNRAVFNEQTMYYEVPYSFNGTTFVGLEQTVPFEGALNSQIIVAGASATNVGQYVATLSLDNQNGVKNYVWANQTGESRFNPRIIRWQIVPYEFDLPAFEGQITYKETPFTFEELVSDAGLVNYYSIMQIGGMTDGVLDDVLMPNDDNVISFSLPLGNNAFKWKNVNAGIRTVDIPLFIQKIVIDTSSIIIVPTGAGGSLTPVVGEENSYVIVYSGVDITQMFTVEIPTSISDLISYDGSHNKYADINAEDDEPIVSVQDVGMYVVYVGFQFDDEIYRLNDDIMFSVEIEKAQKIANVDFAVPTYNTMLAHEFLNTPVLSEIGFGSVPNVLHYSWKNASSQLMLGQHNYRAIYTPLDTKNFDATEFDVSITFLQDIDFTIPDIRYTGEEYTLDISAYLTPQIELISNPQILTQSEVNDYDIVFGIKQEFKQTHCWVDGTNQDKVFVWRILKGVTIVPEFNNGINHYVSYEQRQDVTLADISLSGLTDTGSFAWFDATERVDLISQRDEPYAAVYTPQDSAHYETKQVLIYVNLYVEVPQVVLENESSVYDGQPKTASFETYDTGLISFNQALSANLTNQNAGEYDYYFELEQEYMVWAVSHSTTTQKLTYTINKCPVSLPSVSASAEWELIDGVYTFVYKYTNEYISIANNLPLLFDDGNCYIFSGSVSEGDVGTYSATIRLFSTENLCWDNEQETTDDIVFNWQIVKAPAVNVEAPTLQTVYKNYGIAAPISQVEFSDAGFSWKDPNINLTLGTRTYVALYTPDSHNIEAKEVNVSITFYQTIEKPSVLEWQTTYTGQSQTISNDSNFTQLGYYTWRLNSGSASTTQTDVGVYTLYFIPRNNFVWSDTLNTEQITFTWKIVGVCYSFFASNDDELYAVNGVVTLDEGGRIVVSAVGYTVLYNLDSTIPTESAFDNAISLDGASTITITPGTTDLTFAVYDSNHEIIGQYSVSVVVDVLE